MFYIYDNAIQEDLVRSFNPNNVPNPVVKVIAPEDITSIAAQIQEDKLSFPIVAVTRDADTPIDTDRTNFTRLHNGVAAVLDPKTNNLYYERVIPVKLSYKLTVLTTSTADMDEMVRELLFKYYSMYFLTVQLPYECNRKVRFGVTIDLDTNIERKSGVSEYLQSGQLHQAVIPLRCEGCVLVTYTPAKLKRTEIAVEITDPQP